MADETLSAGTGRPFRILALDGGGIKGAFTAAVLAEYESELARRFPGAAPRLVDHFDLITGTSTGGILAIGLGLGVSAADLLHLYRSKGPAIFPGTGVLERSVGIIRWLFGPKYDFTGLRDALCGVLGERKLGESSTRLVIPSYDTLRARLFVFKTAHHRHSLHDVEIPAWQIARATAAAPTYFEAQPIDAHQGSAYIDGGVWANCPSMVGLVEAVHFLGQRLEDIEILSIGTTDAPMTFQGQRASGLFGWNKNLVDVLMRGPAEAARAQAMLLLDSPRGPGSPKSSRLHRIDATVPPGTFSLDDARSEKIEALVQLGRSQAVMAEHKSAVERRFLNGNPAPKFVPMR